MQCLDDFFCKKKEKTSPNQTSNWSIFHNLLKKNASTNFICQLGNLLSVTVKRMASIIPSKSLVARVRTNQMVIACLGATGAMAETRAVLCFWLDYYNKTTSHMPSYMFFFKQHDAPATFWYGFLGLISKR